MLTVTQKNVVDVGDWDELVQNTYGKPYSFQQQDDCKPRGVETIYASKEGAYDYENATIPEEVNGNERGVSFAAWLARDPEEWNGEMNHLSKKFYIELFWHRNFYPSAEIIAQDLVNRGLLAEGEYLINIDW